jgi:hypothetical protein
MIKALMLVPSAVVIPHVAHHEIVGVARDRQFHDVIVSSPRLGRQGVPRCFGASIKANEAIRVMHRTH